MLKKMLQNATQMRKSVNKGKIIRIISNLYSVLVNDTIIEARARGKFRKDEISPMVGDEVIIDIEKKYNYDARHQHPYKRNI